MLFKLKPHIHLSIFSKSVDSFSSVDILQDTFKNISGPAPEKLFTYDDAGNMTKGYTPDGYEFTATYDRENRLSSIEYTDSQSTVHKAEHIYNGYGFLAQIKKYENSIGCKCCKTMSG